MEREMKKFNTNLSTEALAELKEENKTKTELIPTNKMNSNKLRNEM
jgi:hypothetical protein